MQKTRWQALDSMRGLAVFGMILVVSPGSWAHRLTELDHAAWNGWTIADIVMPLFLFCVGMALGLKASDQKQSNLKLSKATLRTGLLIIIGLILSLVEAGNFSNMRIPGVLQRIAVCYFLAFLVLRVVNKKSDYSVGVAMAFCSLAFANYLLMYGFSVGTEASGELTYKNNLAAIVDRSLFGVEHLWIWGKDSTGAVVYDPEGLLSTIFATANVLAGMLVVFLTKKCQSRGYLGYTSILLGVALFFLATALVLNQHGVQINKKLWSLSFTLMSIGFCIFILLIFELIHSITIVPTYISNLSPLTIFGSNAILAFVISSLMLIFSGTPFIPLESGSVGAQAYTFINVSRFISDPYLASVICATLVCSFIYLLLLPLYRKKIFLRL